MNERVFISLLEAADRDVLEFIVAQDQSIVIYGLNKIPRWTLKLYMTASGGKNELKNLKADDIRRFLRENRPDLLKIIDSRPGWLEGEVERAKHYLQNI